MRATILAIITLGVFAITAADQKYQLVWSDEFNGNQLDLSKWQYEVNCLGGYNDELECYTDSPNNVAVRNGSLVITARAQDGLDNGKKYTSGRINTKASASWKYGRIDVSAKIPNGIYLWPAIWMLPRDGLYGWWAASGEIDIMESRGTENTQETTLHSGNAYPINSYQGSGPRYMSFDMSKDYHVYSVVWTPQSIQFLVDNTPFYSQNLQQSFWNGLGQNPYTKNGQPFDQYFYLILNLAVGGGFFGGNSQALTRDMARNWADPSLYVDYVRVYQLQEVVVAPAPVPSPAPSNPASTMCSDMYNSLTCRTTFQDYTLISATALSGSRDWLCGSYPQFCAELNVGSKYATCNPAEQLSYAMNQYYAQFSWKGPSSCNFGGIGKIVSPTTSTPCSTMFANLQCRTTSQNVTQVNTNSVTNARNWLCSARPEFCADISGNGPYASCNSVEQISYAMNQYYLAVGPTEGASACNFAGLGKIITPVAPQATTCQTMFSQLKCRTRTSDPTAIDAKNLSNARSWLCNGYPQFCNLIQDGAQYSSCNDAEKLSNAMNQYYNTYSPLQGAGACSFSGLGVLA